MRGRRLARSPGPGRTRSGAAARSPSSPRGRNPACTRAPAPRLQRLRCRRRTRTIPDWRCPDRRGFSADEAALRGQRPLRRHDEPAVQFCSTTPGSGNSARYNLALPRRPGDARRTARSPAPSGTSRPTSRRGSAWSCATPRASPRRAGPASPIPTRTTSPRRRRRDHAGTAFMELQFYPPGYAPHDLVRPGPLVRRADDDEPPGQLRLLGAQQQVRRAAGVRVRDEERQADRPDGPRQRQHPDVHADAGRPADEPRRPGPGVDARHARRLLRRDRRPDDRRDRDDDAGAGNGWRHIVWDPKNFNCKGEPYSFHPMFDTAAPPYPNGQSRQWPMWTSTPTTSR